MSSNTNSFERVVVVIKHGNQDDTFSNLYKYKENKNTTMVFEFIINLKSKNIKLFEGIPTYIDDKTSAAYVKIIEAMDLLDTLVDVDDNDAFMHSGCGGFASTDVHITRKKVFVLDVWSPVEPAKQPTKKQKVKKQKEEEETLLFMCLAWIK